MQQVERERQDQPVRLELQDQPVLLVPLVRRGLKDCKVLQERQESLAQLVPQALLELREM